jgi:hypothetical protein
MEEELMQIRAERETIAAENSKLRDCLANVHIPSGIFLDGRVDPGSSARRLIGHD